MVVTFKLNDKAKSEYATANIDGKTTLYCITKVKLTDEWLVLTGVNGNRDFMKYGIQDIELNTLVIKNVEV